MIQMRELTDTELDAVSGGGTASPIFLPSFSPQQANIPTQFGVSYWGNVFQAMGPNINFNFA
jgi:bacteriocin-like protein